MRSDPAPDPADADQPKLSPTAKKFAGKARDLEALRDAVVDAAGVGAGLWLSYLFLFFYLFIAAAAVTHQDLFFENPVKLPFLNVELPLLGFFWLGPLLFIILHAYVLLHFAMLADKVGVFHAELRAQIADGDARERLRRQLPSNIFVQYLAGPHEVRTGIMGLMLRAIAIITLVIFPIALLVFFQLQFLPYHDAWITWWQRFAVLLDILLLWVLWPSIAQGKTTWISWRDFSRGKVITLAMLSAVPLLLIFTIATFPGEWLDATLPSFRLVPTQWPADEPKDNEEAQNDNGNEPAHEGEGNKPETFWQKVNNRVKSMRWTSPHDLLVGGDVDLIERKPSSLWSNRLVLPGIDVIDHTKFDSEDKIAALPETFSLRGRHLEGAVLIGAGLRKVDLTAAYLSNAYLARADLRGAKFGCTTARLKVSNETPNDDNVPSEDSKETKKCAHLQNASLHLAKLPGAQLDRAELQGASLSGAHLEGATFTGAQLQGANLEFAELEGASLDHAELQGASLGRARLQGASLDYAELSGASLESAQMAGASLRGTDLQGAVLRSADFGGALLKRVHVWRIDPLESSESSGLFFNAFVEDPQVKPDEWSVQSYQELRRLIRMTVPEGWARDEALSRIAILDPRRRLGLEEKGEATTWLYLAHSYPSPDPYRAQLSARLQEIACTADGAPYVIQGLRRQLMLRFGPSLKFRAQIVTAFLDETTCPGAHGLSDDDKAVFRKMRDNAAKGS